MREIKFRAWDIEKQDWIYFRLDLFPSQPQTIKVPKQLKIQRGTGLKDKNGKEIYEGDLFNCIYHRDGCTKHIWQVVYEAMDTAFVLKRIGSPCQQLQVRQDIFDVARYEIIGNIYENPQVTP